MSYRYSAWLAVAFLAAGDESADVARLRRLLQRDHTGLAAALEAVIREAESRTWVADGRGPYAWDDDRYKDEAGRALRSVVAIAKRALTESGDRVTAAFHPDRRKRCVDG